MARGEHELVHCVNLNPRAEPHNIVQKLGSKTLALKQAWERHCRLGLACACAREACFHGCSASGREQGARGRRLVARHTQTCLPNKNEQDLSGCLRMLCGVHHQKLCYAMQRPPSLLPQPFERRPVKHANANERIHSSRCRGTEMPYLTWEPERDRPTAIQVCPKSPQRCSAG